jgi:hypothetical protein
VFRIERTLLWLVLACIGTCLAPPSNACTSDRDCRDPRICDGGICRDPGDKRYTNVCAWTGSVSPNFVPGVVSQEAKRLLTKIGTVVPVELPDVRTGPVDTAVALIHNQQRLISFNNEFINRLRGVAGEWAVLFVFAHELGHHVNGDVYRENETAALTGAKVARETAADQFATRVLVRLGANLDQTVAAFRAFPLRLEIGQPDANQRETAVRAEYAREAASRAPRCSASQELVAGECVPKCSRGEQREGKTCVPLCRTDEVFNGGGCRPRCSTDQRWNADANECTSRCREVERWDGSRCEPLCRQDEEWRGNACAPRCANDEYWTGARCESRCRSGESWNGSRCEAQCSDDERWNGRECVSRCRAEQQWNGSACRNRCRSTEEWDGSECVAKGDPPGYQTAACGCHGFVQLGASRPNDECQSGVEVAVACPGWCPLGGAPWGMVCR